MLNWNESWVGGYSDLLGFMAEFCAPGPVTHGVYFGQIAEISGVEGYFFVGSGHDEVLAWGMEVDGDGVAGDVPLAELFSSLALPVKIVESLIPAPNK